MGMGTTRDPWACDLIAWTAISRSSKDPLPPTECPHGKLRYVCGQRSVEIQAPPFDEPHDAQAGEELGRGPQREYGGRMRSLMRKMDEGKDPIFYGAPVAISIHSSVLMGPVGL